MFLIPNHPILNDYLMMGFTHYFWHYIIIFLNLGSDHPNLIAFKSQAKRCFGEFTLCYRSNSNEIRSLGTFEHFESDVNFTDYVSNNINPHHYIINDGLAFHFR